MLKNPIIWKLFLMPGSLLGWGFAISGFIFDFDGCIKLFWLAVCIIWMIVHPLELLISYKIGKEKGIATPMIVIKTILFGFTWWLPLKQGIILES